VDKTTIIIYDEQEEEKNPPAKNCLASLEAFIV